MGKRKTTQSRAHQAFFAEVRNRMLQHGVTQRDLAERLGVTPSSVSRMISGDHNPSLQLMVDIAEALGYEIVVVFDNLDRVK